MSEYIVKERIVAYAEYTLEDGDMVSLPADIREEITRCRDCIHYERDPNPIDPGWPMMCADSGRDMVEPYGFCFWGIRKDD